MCDELLLCHAVVVAYLGLGGIQVVGQIFGLFWRNGDRLDKSTKFFPACLWVLSFDFLIGPNRVVHSDNFYSNFIFNVHE